MSAKVKVGSQSFRASFKDGRMFLGVRHVQTWLPPEVRDRKDHWSIAEVADGIVTILFPVYAPGRDEEVAMNALVDDPAEIIRLISTRNDTVLPPVLAPAKARKRERDDAWLEDSKAREPMEKAGGMAVEVTTRADDVSAAIREELEVQQ